MHRITVIADIETAEQAARLMSDLEEVIGKNDGDLQLAEYENLDEED